VIKFEKQNTNNSTVFSMIVLPLLWLCSKLAPPLLRVTLLFCRIFLNPRFSRMFLDEALLKVGTPHKTPIQSESLGIKQEISVQATLALGDYNQRSFFLFGFPEFSFDLFRFCNRYTYLVDIGANAGLTLYGASKYEIKTSPRLRPCY